MSHKTEIDLDEISLKKEKVFSFLTENYKIIDKFSNAEYGITHNANHSSLKEYQTTSTGFSLYYLSIISNNLGKDNLPSNIKGAVQSLLNEHCFKLLSHCYDDHEKMRKETSTAKLPNNYNTPIQIAGILGTHLALKKKIKEAKINDFFKSLMTGKEGICDMLTSNDGYISRIGSSDVPSPYLTFWSIEVLNLYSQQVTEENDSIDFNNIFEKVSKWALNSLSNSISFKYAGVLQSIDVIDVSYLVLTLLTINSRDKELNPQSNSFTNIKKIIQHSLKIIFSDYFSQGCFTKSLPVFSTLNNFSLVCPTVEPVSLLLIKYPDIFFDHSNELYEIYNWLSDNKFKVKGDYNWVWRSEWEHDSSMPNSFMNICVMTFLAGLSHFFDLHLCMKAKSVLGVRPLVKEDYLENVKYPRNLGSIVKDYIVDPIRENQKEFAAYSIIFFGPPGTAKTTISKKIASDLNWPLLTINTTTFLKRGIENIDAEADKIFRFVSYLKNVVVLFDEVEELVLNRDPAMVKIHSDQKSRLLTTSMLPRINDLRKECRVVFIFATNYFENIDEAISRTGRFDIIHCVLPPTKEERKQIIKSLTPKMIQNKNNREHVEKQLNNHFGVKNFCFADLNDLLKRIRVRLNNHKHSVEELTLIVDEEVIVGKHAITPEEKITEFEKQKEKLDRP